MTTVHSIRAAKRPGAGLAASVAANFDLLVLFCALAADVRVFQGNPTASFTLIELFLWLYCAPFVISCMWLERRTLPSACRRFLQPLCHYTIWLIVASCFALVFRADASVLQNTKNIVPALVLVSFMFYRLQRIESVVFLCNAYVVYAVVACLIGFLQHRYGAPYFHDLVQGAEYKLDIQGNVLTSLVVGLSDHPNTFALAVLPGFALTVFKLFAEISNGWRVRPVTIAAVAVLFAGLVLSQARGEVIFILAGIAFVASPFGKTRSFFVKLAFVCILISAITIQMLHVAKVTAFEGAETVEVRYLLWKTAIEAMVSDAYIPLLGDGTNFMKAWSLTSAGWEFPDSHNVWIDQIVFFGTPAVILYLVIWHDFFRLVEDPSVTPSGLEKVLLDSFRATVIAFMGDFFFAAYANAVFPITQLFFFMALGVCTATFVKRGKTDRLSMPTNAYPKRFPVMPPSDLASRGLRVRSGDFDQPAPSDSYRIGLDR